VKTTTIVALSAAALIAAASAGLAQGVPGTTFLQHKIAKKHHARVSGSAPLREMQAKGPEKGYPRASGYTLGEPVLDRETEMSRKAGGGGGM
jgi:hypothetical protein